MKIVELDEQSRRQQFGEGWFDSLEEVPTRAITLTIPAILRSQAISTECPATILRKHDNVVLFLDSDSSSRLV